MLLRHHGRALDNCSPTTVLYQTRRLDTNAFVDGFDQYLAYVPEITVFVSEKVFQSPHSFLPQESAKRLRTVRGPKADVGADPPNGL